jgi:hypothetical protein
LGQLSVDQPKRVVLLAIGEPAGIEDCRTVERQIEAAG